MSTVVLVGFGWHNMHGKNSSVGISVAQRQQDELYRLKKLLSGPVHFTPFTFYLPQRTIHSPNAGLEGFLHTLEEAEGIFSIKELAKQLPFFCQYLTDLFQTCRESIDTLQEIHAMEPGALAYCLLRAHLTQVLDSARVELAGLDDAAWIKNTLIYQIYPRAFNLEGLRNVRRMQPPASTQLFNEFTKDDLPGPFSAVRWTGVYPVGEKDKKGIGSPFAIADHSVVADTWGSHEAITAKVHELANYDIRCIFELSPNHTAVDAALLTQCPQCYIHTLVEPTDEEGYFRYDHTDGTTYWIRRGGYLYDGVRQYWNDTLQLDISHPETLESLCHAVRSLIKNYGVSGFRVDMAYQLLNRAFTDNWKDEMSCPLGNSVEDEFFYKLIKRVKLEYPHVGFIAEGFNYWELLSAVGFDVIYSKNDMAIAGGYYHHGWYNALLSRDPLQICSAMQRSSFLRWQKGGAGMLAFVGHHDLPSPQRSFGEDWCHAATVLTLFLPVARTWYAGTEAGFEAPCKENQKMITFAEDVHIDWTGLDAPFAAFLSEVVTLSRTYVPPTGEFEIEPLPQNSGAVGYRLRAKNACVESLVVLANPQREAVSVSISVDGHAYTCTLDAGGYRVIKFEQHECNVILTSQKC